MKENFLTQNLLAMGPWQALERGVARLMQHGHFDDVKLVGRTGDGGADILGTLKEKRWVVQVKFRKSGNIGLSAVDEVLGAMKLYRADIPVLATNKLVNDDVLRHRDQLIASGIYLQIWDRHKLIKETNKLNNISKELKDSRGYQKDPINSVIESIVLLKEKSSLVVMATGLGKTFVAAEAIRRIMNKYPSRLGKILVLAHTNELVYQLEKSFWPCLEKNNSTAVWNGNEKGDLEGSFITFACIDSVAGFIERIGELPYNYDLVVIDEAHHAGSHSYRKLIKEMQAGEDNGPYLLGLTATPWRADEHELKSIFGRNLCCIDIAEAIGMGYLSNVDYRMHLNNIKWEMLHKTKGVTIKELNKTLFIKEWDDAVIDVLSKVWHEVSNPRAIVFCYTIDHAFTVRDRINAAAFTRAEIIYSGVYNGKRMSPIDRSVALCDFNDGITGVMCAVNIFNEGIDVPDVNIIVFQRVTHSRRIFIQQLGRGLRISPGKDKVIVLDFVSDIRRIAAGIELKEKLSKTPRYIELGNPIHFVNKTGEDPKAEAFLKLWLDDVAAIQEAGENDHVLKFPPDIKVLTEE